jgi:diacylglycerol kinase family enzyme
MAGIGLDAAVVAATHDGLKKRIGRAAYPLTGLLKFGRLEMPPIHGGPLPRPANLVVVGRTPLYGGDFPLMPDAETFGRRLGLFAFHSPHRLSALKAMLAIVMRGGKVPRSNVSLISRGAGEQFNFRTETACHFQVDGEYAGSAREFHIGVSQQPLKIWLPGE